MSEISDCKLGKFVANVDVLLRLRLFGDGIVVIREDFPVVLGSIYC